MTSVRDLKGKKLLIIKLRYIGDTLSIIPVVDNLREKAPKALIDVMVNRGTEEVLISHPGIKKLWVYDREEAKKKGLISTLSYHKNLISRLRAEKYDVVIDFTHGDRAAFLSFLTGAPHRITYDIASRLSHLLMNELINSDPSKHHIIDFQLKSLEPLGLHDFNRRLELHVPDDARKRVENLLKKNDIWNQSPKVAIHPGARTRFRLWAPDRFGEIARRLMESYGAAIILIGGPGEETLVNEVEKQTGSPVSMKTTSLGILEMAALFLSCRLLLGNDSAPGHIAAAVNCPTLSLFGPTFPHMWRPYNPMGRIIFKDVPCCGCRQEACIRPENNCMDMISVEEVWEEIKIMLNEHDF